MSIEQMEQADRNRSFLGRFILLSPRPMDYWHNAQQNLVNFASMREALLMVLGDMLRAYVRSPPRPGRLVPPEMVDDVVRSAARPCTKGKMSEGLRALDKKIGKAKAEGCRSAFAGIPRNEKSVSDLIRNIVSNPNRTTIGEKSVDVYDAAGRGIRLDGVDNRFMGFLAASKATR